MKKKIVAMLSSLVVLGGIGLIPANAEWRNNGNGTWTYFNGTEKVTNTYVDGKWYVDANGLWFDENDTLTMFKFYEVDYSKNDGHIYSKHECLCPLFRETDNQGDLQEKMYIDKSLIDFDTLTTYRNIEEVKALYNK